MIKKINLAIACIAAFILFSMCKKSTSTTSANSTNTITNNNGYYSVLNIYGHQYVVSDSLTPLAINSWPVFFSATPVTTNTTSSYVKVGSLSLNGVEFKFYSTFYEDSISSASTIPSTWAVVGTGIIPSFTYTNNNPMPTYSGYTHLPDTIYKSQQNTIQITGIAGSDITTVSVLDAGTNTTTQTLASGANSVTFSPSALAALAVGNNADINITCVKNNIQTFSGKQFNFPINYLVNKTIYIK
jgi:hypothetical protein